MEKEKEEAKERLAKRREERRLRSAERENQKTEDHASSPAPAPTVGMLPSHEELHASLAAHMQEGDLSDDADSTGGHDTNDHHAFLDKHLGVVRDAEANDGKGDAEEYQDDFD